MPVEGERGSGGMEGQREAIREEEREREKEGGRELERGKQGQARGQGQVGGGSVREIEEGCGKFGTERTETEERERVRGRERQREREGEKERESEREREREGEEEREREGEKGRERERERESDRERKRERGREGTKEPEKERESETEREGERKSKSCERESVRELEGAGGRGGEKEKEEGGGRSERFRRCGSEEVVEECESDRPHGPDDELWLWVRAVTHLWFDKDVSLFEHQLDQNMVNGGAIEVRESWSGPDHDVTVTRGLVDRAWLEEVLTGNGNEPGAVSPGRPRGELAFSLRDASHVLSSVNDAGGSKLWIIWWSGTRVRKAAPVIRDRLPTRAERRSWLENHLCKVLEYPLWGSMPPSSIREYWEQGQVRHTTPVTLPPCSVEDELTLYERNVFRSPFNTEKLRALTSTLEDQTLANKVLRGLEEGHEPYHAAPGDDRRALDWSGEDSDLDEEEVAFLKATMEGYVKKGFVAGPFEGRPPFPNSRNGNQPSTQRCFTIPKDKTAPRTPDMKRRLIVHGTFPGYLSYNDHIPRQATGRPAHSHKKFLAKLARGGKNALSMFFDMRDCFLWFRLKEEHWHRQCVRIRNEWYVIKVGMFGSRVAGDFAENFMALVRDVFHQVFRMTNVDIYVDNFDNTVAPASNGDPDWVSAYAEWEVMLRVAKDVGIPIHELVPPTTFFGGTNSVGLEVDGHLGWGCSTFPHPVVWVTEKRRLKLRRSMDQWSKLNKFSCKDIASIVGVFQSFESVLACLGKLLGSLYAWKTKCERIVRQSATLTFSTRFFSFNRLVPILEGVIAFLSERDWTVPLIDWESVGPRPGLVIYADAAAPKKLGTAYTGGVWGKGAVALFSDKSKPSKIKGSFYARKHDDQAIKLAMRGKALSAPLLELENYLFAVVQWVKLTGLKHVTIIGDSKTALDDWLDKVVPKDKIARSLLHWFWNQQLELGFRLVTRRLSNTEKLIRLVDRLSKGDLKLCSRLQVLGFEQQQFEQLQYL